MCVCVCVGPQKKREPIHHLIRLMHHVKMATRKTAKKRNKERKVGQRNSELIRIGTRNSSCAERLSPAGIFGDSLRNRAFLLDETIKTCRVDREGIDFARVGSDWPQKMRFESDGDGATREDEIFGYKQKDASKKDKPKQKGNESNIPVPSPPPGRPVSKLGKKNDIKIKEHRNKISLTFLVSQATDKTRPFPSKKNNNNRQPPPKR